MDRSSRIDRLSESRAARLKAMMAPPDEAHMVLGAIGGDGFKGGGAGESEVAVGAGEEERRQQEEDEVEQDITRAGAGGPGIGREGGEGHTLACIC